MQKIIYASWISIILLSACKEKEDIELSGSFSALTYNVAGLPDGISSSHPLLYSSLISPHLNAFDIVHLQEDFCYHDSIMLYNNHRQVAAALPCIGDGLTTLTNFAIRKFERVKWTNCTGADCLSLKGFSYTKIALAAGVTIDFYNIHCNAGSSQESIDARRKNIAQFLRYMLEKSTGEPIIVMGDFNHKYTRVGDSTRVMLDLGFSDPWLDLITQGVVPTMGNAPLQDCYPVNTSSTCEGVDKVFYRGTSDMQLSVVAYKYGDDNRFYYQGDDTQPLSDHSPLALVFEFNYKENRSF
jgi:hypothetical protein